MAWKMPYPLLTHIPSKMCMILDMMHSYFHVLEILVIHECKFLKKTYIFKKKRKNMPLPNGILVDLSLVVKCGDIGHTLYFYCLRSTFQGLGRKLQ